MGIHDMIVLHANPPCEEAVIGLFSGGKQLAGDVYWAHPKGHLRRTAREDACPGLMDICGNYDLWDFVNAHATYPLCGWTRSELVMRVTRPVSRMGSLCGEGQGAGVALAL